LKVDDLILFACDQTRRLALTYRSAIHQRQLDIERLFQISRPFWIETNKNINTTLLINLYIHAIHKQTWL